MRVTEELRKWGFGFCGSSYEVVNAIADRIDELVGREYIELPKGADGEIISIGDDLESSHYEDGTVAGIQYYETGRALIAVRPHGWDTPTWQDPESYTHAKPDSWERIIADAAATRGDFDELVARCKRLAGEE